MADNTQTGRPSAFTQELADRICEQIIEGNSLRTVCKADDMPHASTVLRWVAESRDPNADDPNDKGKYTGFREQYARACEERTEAYIEEIFDIADDSRNDWMEKNFGNRTETVVNNEAIQRSKLRADVRKWYAAKMKPKKYGDYLRTDNKDEVVGDIEVKWKDPE